MSYGEHITPLSEEKMGCFYHIDLLAFCYRPRNQFLAYHRTGYFEDCGVHWANFKRCITIKRKRQGGHKEVAEKMEKEWEEEKKGQNMCFWEKRDHPLEGWPLSEEGVRIWKAKAVIGEYTTWDLDTYPTESNPYSIYTP